MARSAKINIASTTSPLTTTTFTLTSGAAMCYGVYINTALSAHVLNVIDFDEDVSPQVTRTLAVIPASAVAGTTYQFPTGLAAHHSLRIQTTDATATGDVTVMFEPGIPGLIR